MKLLPLKTLLFHNAPLKVFSLIVGYSLWHIATYNRIIETTFSIPLCFNYAHNNKIIEAPETITVTLSGKRSDMYAIDRDSLAAHIATDRLLPGKYGILLAERHLFLPDTIKLVHHTPLNVSFTIKEHNDT